MSLPIAVVDNVDTTTPVTYYVHTDHLSRPILMTDGAKATVWQAEWSPWGAPLSITASPEMNQRFPGQWYQLEAGLHYNWHRHYDPSLGRYTQPDPLGFVDGPSVFAYARNDPQMYVDPDGRFVPPPVVWVVAQAIFRQVGRMSIGKLLDQIAQSPDGGGFTGGGGDSGNGGNQCSGDGRGPLDRCLDAAASDSKPLWNHFCGSLPRSLGTAVAGGKPSARRSCREQTNQSQQRKKNWCFNQFGN